MLKLFEREATFAGSALVAIHLVDHLAHFVLRDLESAHVERLLELRQFDVPGSIAIDLSCETRNTIKKMNNESKHIALSSQRTLTLQIEKSRTPDDSSTRLANRDAARSSRPIAQRSRYP